MKTTFTTHPANDREGKNLLFLKLIKKHKSTSRTELSKLTDVNVVTVSNYVNSYLKKGLVIERGYDVSSGGRRPELVELNTEWGYTIGLDIGEDCIRGVLVSLGMEALTSESIEYDYKKNPKSFIEEIIKKIVLSSKIDKIRIKNIGIGISALSGSAMEDTAGMKDAIEEEIKIPVAIGSSALCAAFGEKNSNLEAMEASSILYIHKDLGEGIFMKDDTLYEPTKEENSLAYLKPWGQKLSIVSEAKGMVERGMGTKIVDVAQGNTEDITLKVVIKAAEEHDEIAADLVRMAGMNLGVRIAYLINLLEPETVVVGGGIEKAGNLFLEPLTMSIKKFILQRILDKIKVTPAVLEEEACAKGSAFLAVRELFIKA